jgi:hypothetical protein
MTRIQIDPTERWLFLGKTGSGKTEGAKYFLREVAKKWPVIIIDPKNYWMGKYPKWAGKKELGTIDKPRLVSQFDPKLQVQIFQPDPRNIWDGTLEDLCYGIMKKGRAFVYWDELDGVVTATKIPTAFSMLWTKGRQLEIGAWCSNQRSLRVPEIVKSQAETWVIFDVPGKKDRTEIVEYTDSPLILSNPVRDYKYWFYHRPTMQNALLLPPLKIKK